MNSRITTYLVLVLVCLGLSGPVLACGGCGCSVATMGYNPYSWNTPYLSFGAGYMRWRSFSPSFLSNKRYQSRLEAYYAQSNLFLPLGGRVAVGLQTALGQYQEMPASPEKPTANYPILNLHLNLLNPLPDSLCGKWNNSVTVSVSSSTSFFNRSLDANLFPAAGANSVLFMDGASIEINHKIESEQYVIRSAVGLVGNGIYRQNATTYLLHRHLAEISKKWKWGSSVVLPMLGLEHNLIGTTQEWDEAQYLSIRAGIGLIAGRWHLNASAARAVANKWHSSIEGVFVSEIGLNYALKK